MIVDRLCSVQVPTGKRVIITGPEPYPGVGKWQTPVTHEEADVFMAYHMIQETAAGHSPIRVVCDDTDVLILVHMLISIARYDNGRVFWTSCNHQCQ
jgi:hypothetical protein